MSHEKFIREWYGLKTAAEHRAWFERTKELTHDGILIGDDECVGISDAPPTSWPAVFGGCAAYKWPDGTTSYMETSGGMRIFGKSRRGMVPPTKETKYAIDAIRANLRSRGVSVKCAAERIGKTESSIRNWLCFERSPRLCDLGQLAGSIGVTVGELLSAPDGQ